MPTGTEFTTYTARASALLFAAAVASLATGPKHDQWARLAWTFGCLTLWAHVALAFQFFHHWSHAQALRHTAEVTARLTRLNTGIGIYLNYLFMLVWTLDCVFWWVAGLTAYRQRRRALTLVLYAFLCFMMFNAAVVFADGPTRYIGLLVCAGVLLFWVACNRMGPRIVART